MWMIKTISAIQAFHRSRETVYSYLTWYSWFASTWQGGHVGGQNNTFFVHIIYMKMEFISQRSEKLLFLTSNMAAVKSAANQQFVTISAGLFRFKQSSINALISGRIYFCEWGRIPKQIQADHLHGYATVNHSTDIFLPTLLSSFAIQRIWP